MRSRWPVSATESTRYSRAVATADATGRGCRRRRAAAGASTCSIAAGVLLLILIVQNAQKVEFDFLFVKTETPLIVALVIAGGLGALIGWALPHVRRSRKAERGAHLVVDGDKD